MFRAWSAARLAACVATVVLPLGGAVAVCGPAAVAGAPVVTVAQPAAKVQAAKVRAAKVRAAGGAAALVASRPGYLHSGRDDVFVQGAVLSSGGLQYVPYERTYHGLPVIGGDFVVVTDATGRVISSSVAQKQPMAGLSTTPRIARSAAARIVTRGLTASSTVGDSHLVVYALGATPRLAWESSVDGETTVDVDARSGAVLDTRDGVLHGTATTATNGPITIATTPTSGGYAMKDPATPSLTCQDWTSHQTFTEPTDAWGTGDPKDEETACADAIFATQTETKMLSDWLGRNGLDGSGGAWPMRVGLNTIGDDYTHGDPQVEIGYDYDGKWMSGIDVVGHENGHGIDDHTPGGMSGNGTAEFIGDAFGIATKWYANEPAPYNAPDFVTADHYSISHRYMFAPPWQIPSGCYSSATTTIDPHDAAIVGDHWFYLLAEGTNPTDGQPVSPTCDGSTSSGVGVEKTIQILYNAMLMKTSASSYQTYRTWTLSAAKNLFRDNCATFNKVKAAWDAVNVTAQSQDPTCTDFAVNPIADVVRSVGDAFSMQLTVARSDLSYRWSATGLPSGVSLDPATGVLSGTSAQPGAYAVVYTATDSLGNTATGSFACTVRIPSPSGSRIAATPTGNGWLPVFATDASDDVVEYMPSLGGWYRFDGALRDIATETNADGRMQLFGVNSAGTVWTRSQTRADVPTALGPWGPWVQIDGQLSSISVARNADGRIEIFGTNSVGTVWHRSQTSANLSGSWTPWAQFDGPTMVKVAAETNLDGRVELFGLDGVGHVFHRAQLAAGSATGWSPWTQLAGTLSTIAVARDNDRLELFGTDANQAIHTSVQVSPGSTTWTPWTTIDGSLSDVGTVTSGGRVELVGLNSAGAYYRYQSSSGSWAGTSWVYLGGMAPATIGVPSVVGQTPASAITTLTNWGFVAGTATSVSVSDSSDNGRVVGQYPSAGTSASLGTTISYYVGVWNGSRR